MISTVLLVLVVVLFLWIVVRVRTAIVQVQVHKREGFRNFEFYLLDLDAREMAVLLKERASKKTTGSPAGVAKRVLTLAGLLWAGSLSAQPVGEKGALFSQPGMIITVALVLIPLLIAAVLLVVKINAIVGRQRAKEKQREAEQLADYLVHEEGEEIEAALLHRKAALAYSLQHDELSGAPRGAPQTSHPAQNRDDGDDRRKIGLGAAGDGYGPYLRLPYR